MIVAAIDIGTNTFRMIVVERAAGAIGLGRVVCEQRCIVRLGEGLDASGRIGAAAAERGLVALRQFQEALAPHRPDAVLAVATSAVREAANGAEFVRRVHAATGIGIEVIAGEEEARRTLLGIALDLDAPDEFIAIDIGGGSTEFIRACKTEPAARVSTGLGVVKLIERFGIGAPARSEDLARMLAHLECAIAPLPDRIGRAPAGVIVGTAGTVTTLAALELRLARYAPERVQNQRLPRACVAAWFERLSGMSIAARLALPGMEPGRADLIVPGAAVLLTAMRRFEAETLVVSDHGLREGLIVDWFRSRADRA